MNNKKDDFIKFKTEIKQFLEEEISSRYYYQNGRLEASFKDDDELKEAEKILNDTDRYTKILTTIVPATKPIYNPDKAKLKVKNKGTEN